MLETLLPFLLILVVFLLMLWGRRYRDRIPAWISRTIVGAGAIWFVISAFLRPEKMVYSLLLAGLMLVSLYLDVRRRRVETA